MAMPVDDAPTDTRPERPPTVNELTLMTIVWFGVASAVCFTAIRGWIRIKYDGRVKLDDILVVFALLLLIASAIMYTIILKPLYTMSRVAAGLSPMPMDAIGVAKFISDTNFYLRVQFAITLAFWTCLWVVKASFLAFFFPLTNGLIWARRFWYAVAAFCAGGYIACVVSYPISCSEFTVGACATMRQIDLSLVSLRMSTILDVSTDLAIMALPWRLLWIVRLSRKEKLAIGSIVGLGLIIVVFAVIRIIVTNTSGTHPEVIWLALWSSIETSVAVVVVCLTSFKVFLKKNGMPSTGYRSQQYTREVGFTRSRNTRDGEGNGSIPLCDVPASGPFGTHKGHDMGNTMEGETTSNNSKEILVR
ncbi:hypothetical protein ONS95_014529 [Cadophora gregata]|uniref:uncharacterized protein n=1 Tax=Cadophora gregata TaxID=51156 RepID=UPI0026DBAD17|nr:uncharacterized protein ONS95_014529 [Cadophora gregata]KAK0112797.1 hypothetical protein ONS95_014529 [Cadophora gregata]KAK0124949.1 hypothetical protein ONS96_008821 [Cadophora gregata f. sp. sojae]